MTTAKTKGSGFLKVTGILMIIVRISVTEKFRRQCFMPPLH